jgi:hypothetical protein
MILLLASSTWAKSKKEDNSGQVRGWKFDAPQVKINYVDLSKAPEIKIYLSFLDRKLRPVDFETFVKKLTVFRKVDKEKSTELFSIADGEPAFPEATEESEKSGVDQDVPPILGMVADEERGLAISVIVPGTAGDAYSQGPLGSAQKSAVADFLKSGKNHKLGVLWVSDTVQSWVSGPNYNRFESLEEAQPDCDKSLLLQLETYGEPPSEEEGEAKKEPISCGLTSTYDVIGDAISDKAYEGFYPHLFGLGMPPLVGGDAGAKPVHERMAGRLRVEDEDEDEAGENLALPAITVAMESLVRDAEAGQPRALVIVGDGRDGYVNRVEESRPALQDECATEHPLATRGQFKVGRQRSRYNRAQLKERQNCTQLKIQALMTKEQKRFASKLGGWLGLARSAGIQIHTIANEAAKGYERDRLEILALRTGGTYRYAQDINSLGEAAANLSRELNEQIVLTFVDKSATPGATYSYGVELAYQTRDGSEKTTAKLMPIQVPKKATGFRVWWRDTRSSLQGMLGKGGFLALMIGLGLILGLLLFVLLKKFFGKKAKGLAGKGKGLKKGLKGSKKAMAQGKKFTTKAKDG